MEQTTYCGYIPVVSGINANTLNAEDETISSKKYRYSSGRSLSVQLHLTPTYFSSLILSIHNHFGIPTPEHWTSSNEMNFRENYFFKCSFSRNKKCCGFVFQ